MVNVGGEYVDIMDTQNKVGQTMRDKLEKAMEYQLVALEGTSGVLTINDPRNDGTANGVSSNYWDVYKSFGYKSAYENALYYGSLLAMADICTFEGNSSEVDGSEYYLQLAEKTKEMYNKLFWDAYKGRYITSINVDGYRADFGLTFVNFYAIKYGLASDTQAQIIYDWLDGKRIIEEDTTTGSGIYDAFKYSAITNTVDVSTVEPYLWWDHDGVAPCTPGTMGGYGNSMQNGGTIFYTSYYDIMGRLQVSADNAFERFNVIVDEFAIDSLRRNQSKLHTATQTVGEYVEGVIGEFPESGLVPYVFVEGFLGIKTCAEGLKISANLPSDLRYAGIREYRFGNRTYSIMVSSEIDQVEVQTDDSGVYFLKLPSDKEYVITLNNELKEV